MSATSPRGQTTLDFLTGMAVFLAVVGFVFLFVPGLLAPTGGGETPLVADRVADGLVDLHLGEPATAGLDATCTFYFFNQSSPDPCTSFDTTEPLPTQLGIDDRYRANITLRGNVTGGPAREVVCVDSGSVVACTTGGTPLAVGPNYRRGEGTVATAQRQVTVAGTDAVLEVRVW